VYDVLAFLEPGLLLDVGAAAGMVTRRMLERSPQSRAIAFEPFPGNHPFLDATVGNDPRVTVIKAAVADTVGVSTFKVGKAVTGTEPGWERFVGYSSLGFVVPDRGGSDETIEVATARIDDHVDRAGARFMKIDVQGGELGVLRSAQRSLLDGRIDIMFVEFAGETDVLGYIHAMGFEVFDSEYLLITNEHPDFAAWDVFRESTLSTGRAFCRAWPKVLPSDPAAFCEMFRTQRPLVGPVQTDLVCVRHGFVDEYLAAAAKVPATE
jgi:FkbM family methyltransferase